MKTLITGAAGFLGRRMVAPFEDRHDLRLMDLHDFDSPHEKVVGDVRDLDVVREAVDGCDAMVIGHMAPRTGPGYTLPDAPFDINVKGTAQLIQAAAEGGVRRIALISSTATVAGYPAGTFLGRDLEARTEVKPDWYAATKVCQETLAEHTHRVLGIGVAVLRVGWIIDADDLSDKYGDRIEIPHSLLVDPRDIGEVARRTLDLPDLGYEVLYVVGTKEADRVCDMAYTRELLDWAPRYDFAELWKAGQVS